MSRYSPQVLPEAGVPFTTHLVSAFDAFLGERARRQGAKEHAEDRVLGGRAKKLEFIDKGGRYGTPPEDEGFTVRQPGPPKIAPMDDAGFSSALAGRPRTPQAPPEPLDPGAFSAALKHELVAGGPQGSAGLDERAGRPAESGPTDVLHEKPHFGPKHPGSFDAATGTFGGAMRPQPAPGETVTHVRSGRYVPLDKGSYVDLSATPDAERARDREAQLALAAGFRQNDIQARARLSPPRGMTQAERLQLEDRRDARQKANNQFRLSVEGLRGTRGGTSEQLHAAQGMLSSFDRAASQAADDLRNARANEDPASPIVAAMEREYKDAQQNADNAREILGTIGKVPAAAAKAPPPASAGPDEPHGPTGPTGRAAPRDSAGGKAEARRTTGQGSRRAIGRAQFDSLVTRGYRPEDLKKVYTVTP